MSSNVKIILVDADVISHFIACSEIVYLPKILDPHKIVVLDNVYAEVARISSRKTILDNLLATVKNISKQPFPISNLEIKKEYALIKKNNPLIGDGERACMAVARYTDDVVASSNFRDIVPYCQANNILYLGTLDILTIALNKGIFDEGRCNLFIQTARNKNNAKFPVHVKQITDYKAIDISFI